GAAPARSGDPLVAPAAAGDRRPARLHLAALADRDARGQRAALLRRVHRRAAGGVHLADRGPHPDPLAANPAARRCPPPPSAPREGSIMNAHATPPPRPRPGAFGRVAA